ncbi:hypothetical protein GCM10009808_02910 [Microbacterium sediminicola]|uniref:DUF7847 domain-containing protein n=1 Tax=Microbacterium sediminicola TaxID=415210 RepID=A0ABP4TKC1_9MICO
MTAYPAWTPAPRPGIVPLHPLTFGTILGRSFSALRHNPRVLLGFAVVLQTLAYLAVTVGLAGIAFASFSRLDTVAVGSDDWDAVLAGSITLTALAGLGLTLAAGAIGVLVQAVVISDVLSAVLAEKMTLAGLWKRVRPVAWRLIGYAVLLAGAVGAGIAVAAGLAVTLALINPALAIVITLVVILGAVPLTLWLTVKLLLVPAAIIVEHASIGRAITRSWRLSRGRFWVILGVVILVSLVFGVVAQIVSVPFSLLAGGLSAVLAPTGNATVGDILSVVVVLGLSQVVILLIQSVAVIVQSTATGLIYIDCRMRHEGLDLDLLDYVDRRDAGNSDLGDPYRAHIGRPAPVRHQTPWTPPTTPGTAPPPPPAATPPSNPENGTAPWATPR